MIDIRGEMPFDSLFQFIRLSDFLMEVQLNPDMEDVTIWKWNAEQTYSLASMYRMLAEGSVWFTCANDIWKCWAPLNCKKIVLLSNG